MSDLLTAAMRVQTSTYEENWAAQLDFVHALLYATADEIKTFVNEAGFYNQMGFYADFMSFPVWLRVLTFRLASLQAPQDPNLLRWTANDLYLFGNEWDHHAAELVARAELLDPGGEAQNQL